MLPRSIFPGLICGDDVGGVGLAPELLGGGGSDFGEIFGVPWQVRTRARELFGRERWKDIGENLPLHSSYQGQKKG